MLRLKRNLILFSSIGISILYWIIETYIYNINDNSDHSILDHLFFINYEELLTRLFYIVLILFLGYFFQFSFNKVSDSKTKINNTYQHFELLNNIFGHDLANIFQVIHSSVEILQSLIQNEKENESLNQVLNMILEQNSNAKLLITNVINLTKLQEPERTLKSIEVYEYLVRAKENLLNIFPNKKILINTPVLTHKVYILADELLLNIFDNLLFNAVKHNRNPQIEIEIKISIEKNKRINQVKIEFEDNGNGIPDDLKLNIFNEIKSISYRTSGMGIGLALIKKIVSIYKGTIKIEDKFIGDYSKGSKFILKIPEFVYY